MRGKSFGSMSSGGSRLRHIHRAVTARNHYRIWDPTVPFEEVADLAVMTLREIYSAEEPSDLRYTAFDRAGNRFVLDDLGLALDR
jgi:hypothetical protein